MTLANTPHLHSLRSRAILFSAAISILIVVLSIYGYSNFKSIYNESSQNLLKRNEILVRLNLLRRELLESYKELNSFLLEPQNTDNQKNLIENIDQVIHLNTYLNQHEWVAKYKSGNVTNDLSEQLDLLKYEVSELIKVRLDINNQYPSLAVGATIMQPHRDQLNNAIALSFNEMLEENAQINSPKQFRLLIKVRHLWSQALSNSRLYLANRVGSFNKNALPIQEKGIETIIGELETSLQKLRQFGDEGKLGFETTDAVTMMSGSLKGWLDGFKKVKVIHHSDEWRQDAKIMKEKISPLIDNIIVTLVNLEQIITKSSVDDVNLVGSLGDAQNKILWLIAFLGIFFTTAIIISLDKLIFIPVAVVSDALKLEALGKKTDHIPVVKTKETQDLIDAFSEMSNQVHIRQDELEYRALHDALTSLPNRTLLLDRVEHDIRDAQRNGSSFSLLVLDLDNFKEVNDTLGHHAGDILLIEAGNRLSTTLRNVDTVARIGGDEFAILLPHTDEKQAVITSKKVLSSFKDSIDVEGIDISIAASIGISVFPQHGDDVHLLLRHADIAMYSAKRNKLGFEIYNEEEDTHTISRLSMTRDFRDAIRNKQLTVNYQPIFDLASGKIISIEALSRWEHPERSFVSPEKFISIAEQTGLINKLTYSVLEESIAQVSKWNKSGNNICIAVNLSVYSFKDPRFIEQVCSVLNKYNFPYENLKFEITESAMMDNPKQVIDVLSELHEMDIKLAVDDFGTGFSSMAYLKELPVDELKIDKSFVIGLEDDFSNDAIVRSTIDLAHNLGLKVIAEGIETNVVNELLRKYKCDMAQGYFLGRPVAAEQLEELLYKSKITA